MEKKGTKIAYFIALAIVVIALVIAKVTNDGSGFVATGWALFPPVVAIALALITKEVYSSLFVGILIGGLLYAGGNLVVGKVPVEEIERRYKAMGFDRAFGPGTDPQVTIACLKKDLGIE